MNDKELELTLKRALRPADPGDDFVVGVLKRIERSSMTEQAGAAIKAREHPRVGGRIHRRSTTLLRWLPISLAACALSAVGLLHWQQASFARDRGLQARGQLFEALSIASAQVNTARAAVIREERSLN